MKNVLVVCTGNSCRSPVAEGLLAKMLEGLPVRVSSAGTDAPVGAPPTQYAMEAAAELGVDIGGHRAAQLTRDLIREADLVLVMERYHRERVLELDPEAGPKTKLLASYRGGPDREIDDPVGRSMAFYRKTAEKMAVGLGQVAADLREDSQRRN